MKTTSHSRFLTFVSVHLWRTGNILSTYMYISCPKCLLVQLMLLSSHHLFLLPGPLPPTFPSIIHHTHTHVHLHYSSKELPKSSAQHASIPCTRVSTSVLFRSALPLYTRSTCVFVHNFQRSSSVDIRHIREERKAQSWHATDVEPGNPLEGDERGKLHKL